MCRYAFTEYKPHLACFRCRKSFKRRLSQDVQPGGTEKPARCPDCGGDVADMGLDFKPPPRDRVREWALLEQMFSLDITFHCCGCSGPGFRPRARAEFEAFLKETIATYETHLQRWEATEPSRPDLVEERRHAIELWRTRIGAARAALSAR